MSEDDFVWTTGTCSNPIVYHTNEDCGNLQKSDDYRKVQKSKIEKTHRPCEHLDCTGETAKHEKYSMGTMHCSNCDTEIKKGALRSHLPCDG